MSDEPNIEDLRPGYLREDLDDETRAVAAVEHGLLLIRSALPYVWHWGDGYGGWLLSELRKEIEQAGFHWAESEPRKIYKKATISRALAKAVFERDAYRCVSCSSHIDLTCDHIVPESRGGATTFDNLQTMCRPCNSKKGAREE